MNNLQLTPKDIFIPENFNGTIIIEYKDSAITTISYNFENGLLKDISYQNN